MICGQSDLVGEANHRIANNLATLDAMVRRRADRLRAGFDLIPRADVVSALTDIHSAIIAMGRLHRTLASEPTRRELALADLLTEVLSDFKSIFQDRLLFTVSIPACVRLDAGRASTFMQAFAEIVANAMKYAHPTGVPVEL